MYKKIQALTISLTILFAFVSVPLIGAIGWSSDTQLTTDLVAWDMDPSITQTASGTIWVVWSSDRIGSQDELYYKTSSDNGITWGPENRLTINAGEDDTPSIFQSIDGTIWVVWASDRTGNFEIFYKTNNGSWSSDIQLTSNPTYDERPSITQDSSGKIWVVWHRDVTDNYDIYYKTTSDNGITWGPEIRLTTDSNWDLYPSITQDFNQTMWVVWASYRTGNFEIFYKTNNGSWSPDTQLTMDPDFDEKPCIIQAGDGSLWVAWQSDRKGNQHDLYYKTSTDYGATWTSDTQLTTDTGDDWSPTIINSHEGRIWVVWTSTRTLNFDIFYKTSDIIPIHDVAVINLTTHPTHTPPDQPISINVTVENQGNHNETFDVNVSYTQIIEPLIGTQTVTLTSGANATLTFEWTPNMTGKYEIRAEANTVPDEADTTDNTRTTITYVESAPNFLMKGMTICAWSAEAYNSSDFDQSITNLANIKANWVTFTVFWFMDTYTSTEMQPRLDLYTASNSSLIHAIQKAHELEMKVALKPMVDVLDGHWRGDIAPTSWTQWFENYRSFINSYAELAEENNVELFEVGTELRSSQSRESEWRQVISEVRTYFSKNITYAANWDSYSTYASLPAYAVKFWDALDYVGVDAYFPLTDSYNPTVEQLIGAWSHAASGWWGSGRNWTDNLYSTHTSTGKEIAFTEIGYCSQNGTNTQPWGGLGEEIDLQEQADCYQAAIEVFKDKAWFKGWFWWNWETDPDAGGPYDDWYPPQNKPAEDVLFEYYSRPRAHVKTMPNNQEGILHMVNVTAFSGTTKITSGISNKSGIATLTNLPTGDIIFVAYAKSDYSQVIANATIPISLEVQSFDLICDQNYADVSNKWKITSVHEKS